MEKEIVIQELNRRNTETVEKVIEDLYAKLYAQQEILLQQNVAIGTMMERMNVLEQQLIIQKVRLTGLGPSKKE